ncbi:AcrR family transcriptional regulator [Amycolatopsis bartoniae]|uniref:TetR family transcriptional regulator n=1 Tax=Amycolatopsis bartoniae TaxID=941986 RepID=A0A8H9IVD8_9PSEU|nr:TetR/AcrR family transcriptional regulator [Amycolatopsis bartoniae]MBB2939274.1 AcrR family transcriptional regulator [Amycolatopsis bartoniae]TVT08730.1 TetR/AcrR family transcriptional regulator [Amycolatopsis bartoniae]GHF37658.1 TetR family transcriptional regulator [Amycolatopsis bartoniae]
MVRPAAEDSVPRRLLAAATKLFAQQGYDRTSVQEIVAAAGVTKGAMYHYFGSKDDLLSEIYGRVLRLQTEQLEKVAATEAPVAERLRRAAQDVVVSTIENLDDMTIFLQSVHLLAPEKSRAVRAERRRYHERFRALVEEGQRAGEFRADKPADIVVDFFFGSVHHLGAWYRSGGRLSAREVGEHYADLLLAGLRP